jgi:hypothetical protein
MFETIDTVPWGSMRHAYGAASDVPGMFRKIVASGPDEVEGAVDELMNAVNHQYSIYEATPYVVPFLIEILSSGQEHAKELIIQVIDILAGYGSVLLEPGIPGPTYKLEPDLTAVPGCEDDIEEALKRWEAERRQQRAEYEALEKEIHKAARDGIPVYIGLLAHPSPTLRASTASLLSNFAEDTLLLAPLLAQAYKVEGDVVARTTILQDLGELVAEGRQVLSSAIDVMPYISLFDDVLTRNISTRHPQSQHSEQSPLVSSPLLIQLAAAAALAPLLREKTSDYAIDILAHALLSWAWYGTGPGGRDAYYLARRKLAYVGPDKGVPAYCRKIQLAPHSPYENSVIYDTEALLDLTFGGKQLRGPIVAGTPENGVTRWPVNNRWLEYKCSNGKVAHVPSKLPEIRPVTRLTSVQKRAIEAIVECAALWTTQRTDIYWLYGLPCERDELTQLLTA